MFINRLTRKYKVQLYQYLANQMIKTLESLPKGDDKAFGYFFEMAWSFNEYCVRKEIYLD